MGKRQKVDWDAIRIAFVNTGMSMRELADDRGVSRNALMSRAVRGGWEQQRKQLRAEITKEATARTVSERTSQLVEINNADLIVSRALRQQIVARLQQAQNERKAIPTNELKSLAHAAESVQRVARIAIGANEDEGVGDVTPEEFAKAARELMAAADGETGPDQPTLDQDSNEATVE